MCTQRLILLANSNCTPGWRQQGWEPSQFCKCRSSCFCSGLMLPPVEQSVEVNSGSCRGHLQISFCYSDVTSAAEFIASDSLREGSLDSRSLSVSIPKRLGVLFLPHLLQSGMLFLRQECDCTCSAFSLCALSMVSTCATNGWPESYLDRWFAIFRMSFTPLSRGPSLGTSHHLFLPIDVKAGQIKTFRCFALPADLLSHRTANRYPKIPLGGHQRLGIHISGIQ